MQASQHHPANEAQRPSLRLSAVYWAIYAIVGICVLAAWALSCSGKPDIQQCMSDGAPALLSVMLQACALVVAVWTGSEVGRRRRSTLLGLGCGTLLFFALSALLSWLGLGAEL